jgi:uncharacterized protein DUF5683
MRVAPAIFILLCFNLFFSANLFAQKDSSYAKKDSALAVIQPVMVKDSIKNDVIVKNSGRKDIISIDTFNKFNPHIATVRSAIIPGWGQAYNKQYWKIPLVYGALGTTAGIFFYNLKTYNMLRKAYKIRVDAANTGDSSLFYQIDPSLQNLSTDAIGSDRTIFRQNLDYSVLFFLMFWGLNVVDASVSAHLKSFDINDDLSLNIHPHYDPFLKVSGLSAVLNIGKNGSKSLTSLPNY